MSNCVEVRLYGFGRGREAYELFDLTKLDDPEEHARLCMLLSAERLLGGATDLLLRESDSAYKDITYQLYVDYKSLRDRLLANLTSAVDGPRLKLLAAIEVAQKLLDRILFIAFVQRTALLPDHLLATSSCPSHCGKTFKRCFGRSMRETELYISGLTTRPLCRRHHR